MKLYLYCNAASNRNMIKHQEKENAISDNNYGDNDDSKKTLIPILRRNRLK